MTTYSYILLEYIYIYVYIYTNGIYMYIIYICIYNYDMACRYLTDTMIEVTYGTRSYR